jgi:hypothetical protein
MITLNHFKDYKGGFDSEDEAARMYLHIRPQGKDKL